MSDEPNQEQEAAEKWVMSEPVFRSSEGYTPKTAAHDPQSEIPTEPGFSDDETEEDIDLSDAAIQEAGTSDEDESDSEKPSQTVRAIEQRKIRHKKKKTGCARVVGVIAGVVALSAVAIVVLLIYFLLFFRAENTTF